VATTRWSDSPLFALARRGRLRWRAALPPRWQAALEWAYPGVAVAFTVLAPVANALLASFLVPMVTGLVPNGRPNATIAAGLAAGFLPLFVLLAAWLWLVEARPLWTIGLVRARAVRSYVAGVGVGLAMMMSAAALLALAGLVTFEAPAGGAGAGWAAVGGVGVLALGWFVQGAAEEALLRGYLLPVVGIRWGAPAGIAVSALVFAGMHGFNGHIGPLGLINLALFGWFAALYALREGGLWGVCAVHTAWNWAQGNLLGLQVSGTAPRWAILVDLRTVGPDVITGGAFGPEGGLAVTAVLAVSIAVVWWITRHGRPPLPWAARAAQVDA
jgi:uncharacterized protein